MRKPLTAVLAALIAMAVAPAAPADTYGGHAVDDTCCYLWGTRADITSPCCNESGLNDRWVMTYVMSYSNPAFMRLGYGMTGPNSGGPPWCGPNTTYKNYWAAASEYGWEDCHWLLAPGYGATHQYSTVQLDAIPGSGSYYGGFIDGSAKVAVDIYWSSPARIDAGALVDAYGLPFGSPSAGHVYGCFGCAGNRAWQRATQWYGYAAAWYTIQQSVPVDIDGNWTIGTTPSPFAVSHPP